MRRFWLPSVLFFLLSISLQQLVCAVEREINVDGTPASSASATKKINKVIDVEAIERAWHKGDDPAELEAEQTFIRKIRQGKLDEEKKRVPKKGAANINSKSRIAQIDKDTQFDVQIFVELKKPINDGVEVDWTENDVNLLGVKWRQRLISSSLSVGFAAVPVFKKLVKKVKGKKKKRQVNNILLVFTVERGYQTVEVMKFLLKQKQTNKVSLDEIQYTIDDLPSEDRQLDSIDDRGDNDEDESEVDNAPAEPRRKKRKVSDTNPSSEGDVDPKGIHGLGGPVRKEPKTYDPLNVNRYGDEAAFGVHLYAELFQEKKKGSGLGWTLGDGDELAKRWKLLISTLFPNTPVQCLGAIGPPPVGPPGGSPPPPRATPPGMTLQVTAEDGWKTYDLLKFLLTQPEVEVVSVHGKMYTKKDLPEGEVDDDDD